MKSLILIGLGAAVAVWGMAYFGATLDLGAHPRWAIDVAFYGAVPGVVLAAFLAVATRFAVYFAWLDLALSAIVVWWGKRMFVASSGEHTFAGQMWFYGWIAVCACVVAVIALSLHGLTQRSLRGRAD